MLNRLFEATASALVIAAASLADFHSPLITTVKDQPVNRVMATTAAWQHYHIDNSNNQHFGRLLNEDAYPSTTSLLQLMPLLLVSDKIEMKATTTDPIVQGLIYFADPSVSIPKTSPTDTIVLQVTDMDHPNDVLAAAKIPLNRARLPLSFQMFPKNILPNKLEAWDQVLDSDVIVQALLCPENIVPLPCSVGESKLQARGIAKVIRNIPGLLPEGVGIRAAASLPLQ